MEERVLELWRRGIPEKDIARKLSLPLADVREIVQKNATQSDYDSRRVDFASGRDIRIIRQRRQGKTYQQISRSVGVSTNVVRQVILTYRPDLLSCQDGEHGGIKYSQATRDEIVRARLRGASLKKIREVFGASPTTVRRYMEKQAPEAISRRITKEEMKNLELRIITMREEGKGYGEISDELGIGTSTVHRVIREKRPNLLRVYVRHADFRVVEMREQGKTYQDIVNETGVSYHTVRNILNRTRPELSGRFDTRERNRLIIRLKQEGKTYEEISRVAGVCSSTISNVLREWMDVEKGKAIEPQS